MVDLKNIVRKVDPKQKSKVGHLVGLKQVDSVDAIIAQGNLSARRSQPSSPRNNSSHVAPKPIPMAQHHLDAMSDELLDMNLPVMTPEPPSLALLSGTSMPMQQPRPPHPTIKVPSQKSSGQRPSQYRAGNRVGQANNEKIIRSSMSSENTTRPQSGGAAKKLVRAPSPIVGHAKK